MTSREAGGDEAAEAGERSEVVHAAESMSGRRAGGPGQVLERTHRSTLHKRVFVLAPESARVQHVAGTRERTGNDKRT